MAERPGLMGRLFALIQGEVSSATLEAYRRAGRTVYDLLQQMEDRRVDLKLHSQNPWTVDKATQAQFLATWNAFMLQTLGDEFLDADYRANPATVGYVPPVTAAQVLAFYAQVEGWLNRAHQAQSNPDYRLDVSVPAALPHWIEADPCPRAHLEAMLAAARTARAHAEAAMAVFKDETMPPEKQADVKRLNQLFAEATTKAEYAESLWARGSVPQELHEQIEQQIKDAVERYYDLGQFLAMPELVSRIERQDVGVTPPAASRAQKPLLPGQPGFDPWCLTDPTSREQWTRDPAARAAMEFLWAHDPNPSLTLTIQSEIDAALARGDIDYATKRSGERLGHFYCCPWAPIYVVKRAVEIGNRQLRTLQQFTFDVSAEEVLKGEFKREILVGSFEPTTRVDYCNPLAGDDED